MKLLSTSLLTASLAVAPLRAQDGMCGAAEEAAAKCFETPHGYVVEIVPGPNGEFPVIDANGNSVFSYRITGPGYTGGSCAELPDVSHASILIPVCDPPLMIVETVPNAEHQTGGQGDESCGFGVGDTTHDVLKWSQGSGCNATNGRTVVMAGAVNVAPTSFSLKTGGECYEGTILGPECGTFVPYCVGSGDCPCANDNAAGEGGCLNSTGNGARLTATGSASVAADDLVLSVDRLPANEMVLFLMSRASGNVQVPLGSGLLCLGGPGNKIVRLFDPVDSGPTGTASYGPGIVAISCSGTVASIDFCIAPGDTWNFQAYYRDQVDGCFGANTSNGLRVTFY